MSLPIRRVVDSPHIQSFGLKIILAPLGILYRFWTMTIRLSYSDREERNRICQTDEAVTIILWHNRLFLAGEWHKRFRKKRTCYGLISGSRDGAWLETFYGWAGIRAIRGSRNRRGSQATRELIRAVKNGNDAGVTPDGSRGPKYQAKTGAIFVARASKSPIVLLSFTYTWCIRLNSWDQFVIPLPFSKVEVKTRLLNYEELFADKNNDEVTRIVESSLLEITHD